MKNAFWSYGFLFFLLLTGLNKASAQNQTVTGSNSEIIQDSRIDELVMKHIQINQKLNTMDGFRIQVFFRLGKQL